MKTVVQLASTIYVYVYMYMYMYVHVYMDVVYVCIKGSSHP